MSHPVRQPCALVIQSHNRLSFEFEYLSESKAIFPEGASLTGALIFSPPAFDPSDNLTRTFRSMDTGSQKRFILVTNVSQSGPTVCPPQNRSSGPRKRSTNCLSISLGPTVIMASPTLWQTVLSRSRKKIDRKYLKFLTSNSISYTLLKTDQSWS